MTTYLQIPPPLALAPYIRFFWVYEMEGISGNLRYIYRSMADACGEMLFHYKGVFTDLNNKGNDKEPLSLMHGQCRHFQRYETFEDFGIFGVYFYPFATQRLFGIPATEFTNQQTDLVSFLGNVGADLEERMMLATDNTERCKILSDFLMQRLSGQDDKLHPISHAIKEVIHATEIPNIEQLSAKYSLSVRQFERQFKALSGFSPKLYTRITRFSKATDQYGFQGKTLTDIAYECGYYDQSHFIHDFKEFSGYHPRAYFAGLAEGIEYRNV